MSRTRRPRQTRASQSGIALILVIWVAALMVLFAAAFSFSVRGESRLAVRESERVRAGAAAEAGLRRIIVALSSGSKDEGSNESPVATPTSTREHHSFEFDGVALTVHVIPELAFIDINVSPEPLLKGLVESAAQRAGGRTPQQIDAAVDSILDWRDVDSKRRPGGAERSDYRAQGRLGPQDQPFMSVAELGQVLNVDRALFEAMQPMATVYSWVPQIDPLAADAEVLAALPGVDSETVQRVLAMREEGADNSEIVTALKSVRRYLARRRSATYTLLAEARADGGVTAIRRAVVKLSRRGKKPVAVLAWYHDAGGRLPEVSAVADVSREDEPDS